MKDIISAAAVHVYSPSLKTRRGVFGTSLTSAVNNPEFSISSHASELASLVFQTVDLYADVDSMSTVERFIALVAGKDEAFVKAFASQLIPFTEKNKGHAPPRTCFKLLRWSILLLHKSPQTLLSSKAGFGRLASAQASLLTKLLFGSSERSPAPTMRAMRALLAKDPALEAGYYEVVQACASGSTPWSWEMSGLIAVLLEHVTSQPAGGDADKAADEKKATYLNLYCKEVLSARTQPPPYATRAFHPLLRRLSHAEFADLVLPAATRALKRSPELVMRAVSSLLSATPLDMSKYAEALVPGTVQLCRHADAALRDDAAGVAGQLAAQCSDYDAVATAVEATQAVLKGSEGRLQQHYQRLGVVAVLQAFSRVPKGKGCIPLACKAATFLCGTYKEEPNEEVKVAMLAAMSAWLSRVPAGEVPEPVLELFVAAAKAPDVLRRAMLKCMVDTLEEPESCPGVSKLTDALLSMLRNGVERAPSRGDAVYALMLLARTAAVAPDAQDRLAKEKVWPLVLQKESAVFNSSVISRLSPTECVSLAQLVELLLHRHPSRVAEHQDAIVPQIAGLLAQLLLHAAKDVRTAAVSVTAKCNYLYPALSDGLMSSLAALMTATEQSAGKKGVKSMDESAQAGPSSAVLSRAFLACAPPEPSLVSEAWPLGQLLLLAHRRCLRGMHSASTTWVAFSNKMVAKDANFVASVKASMSDIWKVVLSEEHGLLSPSDTSREAALASARSLARLYGADAVPPLLEQMGRLLDPAMHHALSDQDIEVFNTPPGVLSSEVGVYKGEVVANKNQRRARGRVRMDYYDADDEPVTKGGAAAAPAKAGAAAPAAAAAAAKKPATSSAASAGAAAGKKGPTPGKGKPDPREAELAAEEAVRARVWRIGRDLALALDALAAAARGGPDGVRHHLPEMASLVYPFMSSPLVAVEAAQCLEGLACALPSQLRPSARGVAAALRVAAITSADAREGRCSKEQYLAAVESSVVEGAVNTLWRQVEARGALEPTCFCFCFPVLELVMRAPKHTHASEHVLAVVKKHAAPGTPVPRVAMIHALYHVLSYMPSAQAQVLPVLQELCRGLDASSLEAALAGLLYDQALVRSSCLQACKCVPPLAAGEVPEDARVSALLWMACYDSNEQNMEHADEVYDMYGHDLSSATTAALVTLLSNQHGSVRLAAAKGLAAAMEDYPETAQESLQALFKCYRDCLPKALPPAPKPAPLAPLAGKGGPIVISIETGPPQPPPPDKWEGREGVALALRECVRAVTPADLPGVITFLISTALSDGNADVREHMVQAGVSLIDACGRDHVGTLLPIFERFLEKKEVVCEETYDLVREGVVVFLGASAKHLAPTDPKVLVIVERLLEVLNTPSEAVQRAVSDCLVPLMSSFKAEPDTIVGRLLERVLKGEKYAVRRGAAFGLGGVIKGLGMAALSQCGVMDKLKAAVEDKASPESREGALFAFECLSEKLGRLFEPYVIHILPLLLVCFSDPVAPVRDATEAASRAIMGQLTGQGVKLVLPALLKGLEDRAWRTKQGSIQLLGAMAFCAPKQLSSCLPTIVPNLSEVLTDTHSKVQAAAHTALEQVGSVIRNPEIAALVPVLIRSLSDPTAHTKGALETLLGTTFVNTVDAPSLALLVPIVHRGLRERGTDVKKKAAAIVGNMCSLVSDARDMLPYLDMLLPELKKVLLDPIPEARAVAAKSLGALIQGMGEDSFRDLVPWLLETLKSDASSVERSGAAQGLSEVFAALGNAHFEALLPDILDNCRSAKPHVREGYVGLFKYLPLSFRDQFEPHLTKVLPSIINCLADESELVRDASLKAGHVIVELYGKSSLTLLLPAVEAGVASDKWRIRHSSVELLGELLFNIAGTSGKIQHEGGSDDEGASTEVHGRAILETLGLAKRNELLATLYMCRSDTSLNVRQSALQVWKSIVANTPRTLKEILPVLMRTVIASLAAESEERRQSGGRCLGELVRKLGDRFLPLIIPTLREGLQDANDFTRQGVCNGLNEVISSAAKQQIEAFLPELVPTIQSALCDRSPAVRVAAAQSFAVLQRSSGMEVVDAVVPNMLSALRDTSVSAYALDGLKQILSLRSALVLPRVLPQLLATPITAFNARAIAALADVAAPSLQMQLSSVLPPLIEAMGSEDAQVAAAAREAAEAVVACVQEEGLHLLVQELVKGLGDTSASTRRGCAHLLGYLYQSVKLADALEEQLTGVVQNLLLLFIDPVQMVIEAAWAALGHVMATVPEVDGVQHVRMVVDAVDTVIERQRRKRLGGELLIPGFCLPKSLAPVLPVYKAGLMSGSAELRELAADGLARLMSVSAEASISPFVININGALIKVIGDRFPWQVKLAILGALEVTIRKGGAAIKPFVSILQTTFTKCLFDGVRNVRDKAAKNLGKLMRINPRVDPVVDSLLTGVKAPANAGGPNDAHLLALEGVVTYAGERVSAPVLAKVQQLCLSLLPSEEEFQRRTAARTLGSLMRLVDAGAESGASPADGVPFPQLRQLIKSACAIRPDAPEAQNWLARHGAALTLAAAMKQVPARITRDAALLSLCVAVIKSEAKDDNVPVREACLKSARRLIISQLRAGAAGAAAGADASDGGNTPPPPSSLTDLLPTLVVKLGDDASSVRQKALSCLKNIAKSWPGVLAPSYATVVPPMAECIKDKAAAVRVTADRALFHALQVSRGGEHAQALLIPNDARRLGKLPAQSDDSDMSDPDENWADSF
eukprot:jgi/Mesvir1/26347/Mv22521-RA.1